LRPTNMPGETISTGSAQRSLGHGGSRLRTGGGHQKWSVTGAGRKAKVCARPDRVTTCVRHEHEFALDHIDELILRERGSAWSVTCIVGAVAAGSDVP